MPADTPEQKLVMAQGRQYAESKPWLVRPSGHPVDVANGAYYRLRRTPGVSPEQIKAVASRLRTLRRAEAAQQRNAEAIDLYGEIVRTILDHNPIPPNANRADAIMHVLAATKGKTHTHAFPRVGEEGMLIEAPTGYIGRGEYDLSTGMIFDDGSIIAEVGFSRYVPYAPGSKQARSRIKFAADWIESEGQHVEGAENADKIEDLMWRSPKSMPVTLWNDYIGEMEPSNPEASVAEAVNEYRKQEVRRSDNMAVQQGPGPGTGVVMRQQGRSGRGRIQY